MIGAKLIGAVAAIIVLHLLHSPEFVNCQVVGDEFAGQINDTAFLPFITQTVYNSLSNLTSTILNSDVGNQSEFCIQNRQVEWDRAFNFSSNLDFLTACIQKTNGDVSRRLCNSAELRFYFGGFFSGNTFMRPNRNCNLTSRVPGCEPGWACATSQDENVDMQDSQNIPARSDNCQSCCEGFFCPRGLTCMIPCPLGSHCDMDRKFGKKYQRRIKTSGG